MISAAAKLWFAIAGLATAGFAVYEIASHGDWYGSFVLGTVAVVTLLLGILASSLDVSAEAVAAPEVQVRNALPAPWPALLAVGAGVAGVGLAGKNALLWVGVGIVGIGLVEWMVQSWAERASADASYNQALRHRIMSPVEIPLVAVVVIGGVLLALSRLLLALPKTGATVAAIVIAAAILAIATLVTSRPRIGSSALAGLLAAGAAALIATGIVSGIVGQRDFEKHGVHEESGPPDAGHDDDSTPAPQP